MDDAYKIRQINIILNCYEESVKDAGCQWEKDCAKDVAFRHIYELMRGDKKDE